MYKEQIIGNDINMQYTVYKIKINCCDLIADMNNG